MPYCSRYLALRVMVVVLQASLGVCVVSAETAPASEKKGFCTSVKNGEWLEKVEALHVRWFYSWGLDKPEQTPADVEFTPMMWGRVGRQAAAKLDLLRTAGQRGEVRNLLGFNEPDQNSQSNISVKEALNLWPKLMQTELPLGSPSCVHPDRQWMKDFMRGVEERGLRVDFVCVHSYGPPIAKALVDRLRGVHEMFDRPIWITELAVGDWNAKNVAENRHAPEEVARFMRELLPRLEKLDFVHRYAWFSAEPDDKALGTSALFDKDGELTDLGRVYSAF